MHERTNIQLSAADRKELEAVVANRNSPQKHVWGGAYWSAVLEAREAVQLARGLWFRAPRSGRKSARNVLMRNGRLSRWSGEIYVNQSMSFRCWIRYNDGEGGMHHGVLSHTSPPDCARGRATPAERN
jgi:hypothetical protein